MADPFKIVIEDEDDEDYYDDEHSSDSIFPHLEDDIRPKAIEWEKDHTVIRMLCGCMVEICTGDTMWVIKCEDGNYRPIAVDPVTIH